MSPTPPLFDAALAAWPTIWLVDFLRYLLTAGALAGLLLLLPQAWLARRRVRIRQLSQGQQRREFWRSCRTAVVFSLTGALVYAGDQAGVLNVYDEAYQYGVVWFWLSLPVLLLLHDSWFYWTHRLMHLPRWFGPVHRAHHESVAPTVWAAYSFTATDALIQSIFLPLVLLVLPLHPLVIFAWMTHMIVRNVMGHCGTELLPRSWLVGWWGRWLTTTLHHEMHHAHGHSNYALYFTWWDAACGTEHPQYKACLAQLVSRIGGVDAPPPDLRKASRLQAVSLWLAGGLLMAAIWTPPALAQQSAHQLAQRLAERPDLRGEWATQGYGARVLVKACPHAAEQLCGTITWLWTPLDAAGKPVADARNPEPARRERPLLGLDMLSDFKPTSQDPAVLEGKIYNPEDGRTYNATMRVLGSQWLEVKGCVLVFCSRQVWRRLPLV
jgi:Delta7-sterol 5-desaturase